MVTCSSSTLIKNSPTIIQMSKLIFLHAIYINKVGQESKAIQKCIVNIWQPCWRINSICYWRNIRRRLCSISLSNQTNGR